MNKRVARLSSHILLVPITLLFVLLAVPPSQRGKGIAEKLAQAALEHAKSNSYTVVPVCSYIEKYLTKHPEYQELVQQ